MQEILTLSATILNLDWSHKAEFNAAEEKDWNNGAGLARTANGLTLWVTWSLPTDQPANALIC